MNQMDEQPGIQITAVDLAEVSAIREQLPLLKHRMDNL